MAVSADEIEVRVDPRLAAHTAKFVENRKGELGTILDLLARGDFHAIRTIGHNLKGAGGGFGMMVISDLGKTLETAAVKRDAGVVRTVVEELRAYLSRVRLVEGTRAERPSPAGGRKRKILVVDDDRDVRELLSAVLAEQGYEVEVVPNGLKLVSALRVDRPDLVLLDVMMSWINGFDLCRSIKQNHEFSLIPIVFISARNQPIDVQRGMECGAVAYVTKPIDLDKLLACVKKVLDGQPAREI
jgi:CheY-like chemotaxis protein